MKNIHVLPSINPSGIHFYDYHITSDEEIKEGDWVYCTERKLFGKVVEIQLAKQILDTSMLYFEINDEEIWCKLFNCKKIILTTDQDLIDVQAIDDEFLEWFVKNPSCENVETQKWFDGVNFLEYKIIIPKEIDMLELGQIIPKEESKIYTQDDYFNDEFPKEEPKKETLEEAIDRIAKEDGYDIEGSKVSDFVDGMVKGAKWQQERSYSEEDMLNLGKFLLEKANYIMSKRTNMKMLDLDTGEKLTKELFQKWFEQFKKK